MRPLSRFLLLATAVACTSCAPTRLVSTWSNPEVRHVRFHKILAVAVTANESDRRRTEDAMVRELGAEAVPSYTLFPGNPAGLDRDAAKREIAARGFDGAVVLRTIDAQVETNYVPGSVTYLPVYRGFYGYWGYAWGAVYSPGYLETNTIVKLETLVYDVSGDRLVWASQSQATNPRSVADLVPDIARSVKAAMRKRGLIGSQG